MNHFNYENSLNNTDKFSGGFLNDGNRGHNYQLLYKNFINNDVKSILEIGTANGGFAKFLRNNLLNCFLVGADISPEDKHYHVSDTTNHNNLYDAFYVGDCFSDDFINWIKTKSYSFDFVVEDAEHTIEQQVFMVQHSELLINSGGVYICEDVSSYAHAKYIMKHIPSNLKKYAYIWEGSDSIGRLDDICIVIDTRN